MNADIKNSLDSLMSICTKIESATTPDELFHKIKLTVVAKIKNNLGICYREQGDTARAELFFQDALNLRLSLFNDNHLDVAQTYAGLGRLYRTIGHYSLAAEYFQKALVIREKLLGMDHEDVQQTIRNLEECRTHL